MKYLVKENYSPNGISLSNSVRFAKFLSGFSGTWSGQVNRRLINLSIIKGPEVDRERHGLNCGIVRWALMVTLNWSLDFDKLNNPFNYPVLTQVISHVFGSRSRSINSDYRFYGEILRVQAYFGKTISGCVDCVYYTPTIKLQIDI